MSGEEVMPDFDIGIVGGNGVKDTWQSPARSEEASFHREDSMDSPDQLEERVGRDTQKQLKHLLNLSEASGKVSRSRDRGPKRSRQSDRRSKTLSRGREMGHGKIVYACPTRIVEIFGKGIPAKTLCALSVLKNETPAAILDLVPTATTEQICKMCTLLKEPDAAKPEVVAGSKIKRRQQSSRKSAAESAGDATKKKKDKTSPEQQEGDFLVPTPVTRNWTKRLKNLVQNAGVDRGSVGVDNELESHSSEKVKSDDTSRNKVIINDEALFKKLKNNVKARSKLSTIHSARSYKYGHVHFGPKSWYKERDNISEKLSVQEDKRKFRQGLKCNVDFLSQINMHDLMKILITGEQKLGSLHKTIRSKLGDIFECLKDIPIIDIPRLIDAKKAEEICSTIDKIAALAHLSQSMGNYFARDDSLDPALSTVCQALRGNIDIEYTLRKRGGGLSSQ